MLKKDFCTLMERDIDNYLHAFAEQTRRLKATTYDRLTQGRSLKALVVHNEGQAQSMSFELTEFLLERECRTVLHAKSILEVVDILAKNDINIIVVDMDYQNSRNPDFIKFIDHIVSDFSEVERRASTQVVCLSKNKLRYTQPFKSVSVYQSVNTNEPLAVLDKALKGAGNKSQNAGRQLRTYRAIDIS